MSAEWDASARARGTELHTALTAAGIKCEPVEEFPRREFLVTFVALNWPIPQWAAHCTLDGGEDLQLEIYADSNHVKRREATRRERFCEADEGRRPDSIAYVAGPDFVLTPDTIATAKRLAPILGGSAREQICPT
jgi:hypothetical protein